MTMSQVQLRMNKLLAFSILLSYIPETTMKKQQVTIDLISDNYSKLFCTYQQNTMLDITSEEQLIYASLYVLKTQDLNKTDNVKYIGIARGILRDLIEVI